MMQYLINALRRILWVRKWKFSSGWKGRKLDKKNKEK